MKKVGCLVSVYFEEAVNNWNVHGNEILADLEAALDAYKRTPSEAVRIARLQQSRFWADLNWASDQIKAEINLCSGSSFLITFQKDEFNRIEAAQKILRRTEELSDSAHLIRLVRNAIQNVQAIHHSILEEISDTRNFQQASEARAGWAATFREGSAQRRIAKTAKLSYVYWLIQVNLESAKGRGGSLMHARLSSAYTHYFQSMKEHRLVSMNKARDAYVKILLSMDPAASTPWRKVYADWREASDSEVAAFRYLQDTSDYLQGLLICKRMRHIPVGRFQ